MRKFQDTLYACKRVSKQFKKPCSPIFLDNYEQNETKKLLHTFVDIAKEAVCEQIQTKETLLELELLEVFVSLNKRPDFWKSLSKIIYNFSLQNQYSHIKRKYVFISKVYFKVYTYLNYCSRLFLDLLILHKRKQGLLHLNYLHTCLIS